MVWMGDPEELAQRMLQEYPLKPMRAHIRTYKNAFVVREAVYWLIRQGIAEDESTAVQAIASLLDCGFISNVSRKGRTTVENNKDILRFYGVEGKGRLRRSSTTSVGPADVRHGSVTGMMTNPLAGASTGARKESFSISTPDGDDVMFAVQTKLDWSKLTEEDVIKLALVEMQRGSTSLHLMRDKLTAVLTEQGFSQWKPLIKQLIDKYGGQVQRLLRRLDQQSLELAKLAQARAAAATRLVKFGAVATATAARLNQLLELTSAWDVPPVTYTQLQTTGEQSHLSVNNRFWATVDAGDGGEAECTNTPAAERAPPDAAADPAAPLPQPPTPRPAPPGQAFFGGPRGKARQDSGVRKPGGAARPAGMRLAGIGESNSDGVEEGENNAEEREAPVQSTLKLSLPSDIIDEEEEEEETEA
mmetsp:Transcript_126/g.393  ORF Transcript_126/g.393 Transcript_126/m.393 type:complete len:417 (+) Transcript_126:58-1308(+)